MRRFLALGVIIFMFIVSLSRGFVQRAVESLFYDEYFSKVNGNVIEIKKDNEWETFEIKGVNLSEFKPGLIDEETATEEDYLRWINYIGEMNANTIRVSNLMPREFYAALENYNSNNQNTMYVLQGIYLEQNANTSGNDIESKEFDKLIKNDIEKNINYIHGKQKVDSLDTESVVYDIDVSEYIIGYTLGSEWLSDNIIYYEIMSDVTSYEGEYFKTKEGASAFESYLASIADYLVKYESKYYNEQKLISFVGTAPYKVLLKNTFVDETIDEEDRKVYKSYVDVENIEATDELQTGLFVSYNLNQTYSELFEYFGKEDELLKEINDYHTIPVVISEYGIPSSRTVGDYITLDDKTYISEEDQATLLEENYTIIKDSECAGSFLVSFQDNWSNRTWNTNDSVDNSSLTKWNDAEGYNTALGILSFDAGEKDSDLAVDGSNSEWTSEDIISQNTNYILSSKQDENYIYFYVKSNNGISLDTREIYINLDVTPNSGSLISSEYSLTFDRAVDFIVEINGEDNSRVLVHEYYNSKTFIDNKKNLLIRPDLIYISKDVDQFSNIELNTSARVYVERERKFSEEIDTEVGKLIYGSTDISNKDYNSEADFYYGEDFVEVRIPWGLINFMDPSTNLIKDDCYENLSFKPLEISEIYIGATIRTGLDNSVILTSEEVELNEWETPNYSERLKLAYYSMKEVFGE